MVSYPQLTIEQQAHLPQLLRAPEKITALFDDCSHDVWRCDTSEGPMVLKVCRLDNISRSPFWLGVNQLFDANFPQSLSDIHCVYERIREKGNLTVPKLEAAEANSFILAGYQQGESFESIELNENMVMQLAQHLGKLHQQKSERWGRLSSSEFDKKQWPKRLENVLSQLIEQQENTIPSRLLKQAMDEVSTMPPQQFVPIMLDLRWDQFLYQDARIVALVDLDAFVVGPQLLELVLLEYLLPCQYGETFKNTYQHYHPSIDLSQVRTSYRLLLFLMNVLGEKDIEQWMKKRRYFKC